MRTWKFWDNSEAPTIITDDEIREEYWPYWHTKMVELGRYDQITIENCIQDFVTVYWAWEVRDGDI